MENKRYTLKTVEEIVDLIDENNFANFMIDFTDLMIKVVQLKKDIKKVTGNASTRLMKEFDWIDDGENGTKEIRFNDGKVLKFDTFKNNND